MVAAAAAAAGDANWAPSWNDDDAVAAAAAAAAAVVVVADVLLPIEDVNVVADGANVAGDVVLLRRRRDALVHSPGKNSYQRYDDDRNNVSC